MFFLKPLQFHLQPPDLLVELGHQGGLVVGPAGPGAPEDLGQPLQQLLLPAVDLAGVDGELVGQLVDRLPFAQSLQGHLGLELRRMRLAFPRHPSPSGQWVGGRKVSLSHLSRIWGTLPSSICGYTDADLDAVFAPELPGLDRDEIRDWYNGYNWLGEEKVYNPFDILLLFRRREFGAWWFETGTPAFLVETLFRRRVSSLALDDMLGSSDLLSAFDVDHIATEALLFQTGYLTIRRTEPRGRRMYYRLGYPNQEVRQSLNESLLNRMTGDDSRREAHSARLYDLLLANDFAGLETLFRAFFASIPYEWYTSNDIASYEGYYASVFYSYFAALESDVTVEDSSSHGRLDMAVRFNDNVYLFEFKVVEMEPEGAAMAQLKERRYADKYRGLDLPIYLVAVEFSRETRNLAAFSVERA